MKVIVGLGNPGAKYTTTRHNIGFLYLDYLQQKFGFSEFADKPKLKCLVAEGTLNGEKCLLVKPTTFMNLSGEAVLAVMNFYKLEFSDFLICYDDVDLMFGVTRYRESGSSGTHNGMRSIIGLLGTQEIPRLRFGVDIPDRKHDLASFVLANFDENQLPELKSIFEQYEI
jgi:PTH1 family peptidyl-tRNA hydrolase